MSPEIREKKNKKLKILKLKLAMLKGFCLKTKKKKILLLLHPALRQPVLLILGSCHSCDLMQDLQTHLRLPEA